MERRAQLIGTGLVLAGCLLVPAGAAIGQRQQPVNPAPVNYWMDISTGETASGGGMMAGMMGGMMGGGASGGGAARFGGSDNWFGAAQQATPGRFTDIAVFDRRRPGTVTASQAIPQGARLGPTLPLLPPPPLDPRETSPWDEPRPPGTEQGRMPRITIKYYWGCGAQVRPGQPQTASFDANTMQAYGRFINGRSEPDRGATSNRQSSTWPNRDSHRVWPDNASLVGEHAVMGQGLPASLRFQLGAAQDFLPPMGLRSAGSPTGVLTLSWTNLTGASAYFVNAFGMEVDERRMGSDGPEEMTMILWSASETPDPGNGLMGFLSNSAQDRFLADRTLLRPGTTICQIPTGIFREAMMVMIGGVAYGRELNLVHPARPADPRTPWNQEWTARIRVKSQSSLTLMPGMGAAVAAGARGTGASLAAAAPTAPLTPEQHAAADLARRQAECDAARQRAANAGSQVGGVLGGSAGGLLGGIVGRNQARNLPECEGLDPPAQPQGRRRN